MAKSNTVIKLLKAYQEKTKMFIPEMYASFSLALKECEMANEDIKTILELTEAIWEQAGEKGVNLVKWAEEETGINLHDFDLGKAKISKES